MACILKNEEVAQLAHRPRLVVIGGGYPVVKDSVVIGGIGVSGGTVLDDQKIAEEALTARGFTIPS